MGYFESFIGVNFWTALFVLLNTLLIYFVARKYLFGPIQKIISQRQNEIDSMYDEANKARADAESMQAEYRERLTDAQNTSEQMVKDAMARAHSREEEILSDARTEAAKMLEKASGDIALEKKKAVNDAKDEISSLAMAIAGKVVGRELNEKDQAALVDHFIDELGDNK